jgi:hypothetical protein
MVQTLTNLLRRAAPPGANRGHMRDLLFADQLVTQLPALPPVDNADWPGRLALAAESIRKSQPAAAIEALRAVMADETAASRAVLWAATTLRMLGQSPARADDVLGAVLEVPVGNSTDVLAAYADGTARYVNHAGPMIIWEVPDPTVHNLIRDLLAIASPAVKHTVPAQRIGEAPSVRLTLLLTTGNRSLLQGSPAQADVIKAAQAAGLALMLELIKRSKNH